MRPVLENLFVLSEQFIQKSMPVIRASVEKHDMMRAVDHADRIYLYVAERIDDLEGPGFS